MFLSSDEGYILFKLIVLKIKIEEKVELEPEEQSFRKEVDKYWTSTFPNLSTIKRGSSLYYTKNKLHQEHGNLYYLNIWAISYFMEK